MKRVLALFGLAAFLLLIGSALGCSGSKGLRVNIAEGEYYSEEEYDKLSGSEKEAYCDALAKELSLLKQGASEREGELKTTKAMIDSLKSQLGPLEATLLKLDSDIRTLESQLKRLESLPKSWKIKTGECLWTIAGYEQVYSDPVKWPRLFRANMDKIEDPDYIYPDTVIAIPRDLPRQHRVVENECLWLIAGYWEIYGSPLEWTRIFEANRDYIQDPDLIKPEQVLTIPR